MEGSAQISLDHVRQTAREVAEALQMAGRAEDALLFGEAIAAHGSDAEALLAMRSALVSTRNRWELLDDAELVAAARAALGAAKRLSIDM